MESQIPKKSKKINSQALVIISIVFIVFSLVGGYYYGVWETKKNQLNLSLESLLQEAPSYLANNDLDVNLFWRVWQNIKSDYVEQPVDEEAMFYGALEGMVRGLKDPYSVFFDPEATKEFNDELSGSIEGIGAEIGVKNNQLTIIAPLDNSPASEAGLKAGDKILKIDEHETAELSLDVAVSLIRGEKGSTVTLTILSKDDSEIVEVPIKRDVITIDTVDWEMKEGSIAYIEISHFNSDTYKDFTRIANQVLLRNPSGIIIDLRNNPGGYLYSAVNIAGEFIENNVIVIEDFGDNQKEYKSEDSAIFKDFKIVVLVNQGSASASEIVAGALQDYGLATIIGERTFGKGSVQDYQQFKGGSSLKLTVAKWLTPSGTSIEENGIQPDIEVELTEDNYNNDEDPQLDAAISLIKESFNE